MCQNGIVEQSVDLVQGFLAGLTDQVELAGDGRAVGHRRRRDAHRRQRGDIMVQIAHGKAVQVDEITGDMEGHDLPIAMAIVHVPTHHAFQQ